jgi:predicted NUDIX family NTP pyrophosphohydrolase
MFKKVNKALNIFLVHPGGPFWQNKDAGAWSIPKGEFTGEEKPLDAAIREFNEETGIPVSGDFIELSPVKLKSGKLVHAWAVEGEIDTAAIKCETFIKVEWPPRSGKFLSVPEVDRGEWFSVDEAKTKVNPAQVDLINELIQKLDAG